MELKQSSKKNQALTMGHHNPAADAKLPLL